MWSSESGEAYLMSGNDGDENREACPVLTSENGETKSVSDIYVEEAKKKTINPYHVKKGWFVKPELLDLSGSFDQQLERVLAAVRLSYEDVAEMENLWSDVESVLQEQWPGCTVTPFGSIVTGLGTKTSDSDCYVSVPEEYVAACNQQCKEVESVALHALKAKPQMFRQLRVIGQHIPIVQFVHVETKTKCDLTFTSPMSIHNSKLILFLLHSDPRLIPLVVLIKYWAKVLGICGKGRLSGYALILLVVFYLQQPPVSILPSVAWLQKDVDRVEVEGWNTGFVNSYQKLPRCSNTSTILELLGGFFHYYANFKFEQFAISPYVGLPINMPANILHHQIQPCEEWPDYAKPTFINKCIYLDKGPFFCIQDPFVLHNNITWNTSSRRGHEIRGYFKFAAQTYNEEVSNNCEGFLKTILLTRITFRINWGKSKWRR